MNLNRKTIWLTGASSGIGEALARELIHFNGQLILSARNEQKLIALKKELGSLDRIHIVPLDLAESDSFKTLADSVRLKVGGIDVLINNAGISQRSLALETTLEVSRRLMEINFFGTIALCQAVLPDMLKRNQGQLVVVSSLVGKFGTPLRSSYAASKHALHGYFDSLRAEIHQSNISISLICPGWIQTAISLNALTGDGSKQNSMDQRTSQGLPAQEFAKRAIRSIENDAAESLIGNWETKTVWVKRLFPWLFRRILNRAKVV
ncbi:SDR family oxidoreductase [Chitinophagales bacterium]|nr:SDR family oxidoreductase [Chitinophagales bacterium]